MSERNFIYMRISTQNSVFTAPERERERGGGDRGPMETMQLSKPSHSLNKSLKTEVTSGSTIR